MKKVLLTLLIVMALPLVSFSESKMFQVKLAATPHSNTLTITAGASIPGVVVTSYNVYKSLTSGSYSAPFASVPFGSPATYVDIAVISGQKTFYVLTAVCGACSNKESAFSAEVSAVTPADGPPNPPSVSVTAQ